MLNLISLCSSVFQLLIVCSAGQKATDALEEAEKQKGWDLPRS